MPRRNLLFRALAAAATFSAGALLVGVLTYGHAANAEKPAPTQEPHLAVPHQLDAELVTSLTTPQPDPAPPPPKVEAPKPKSQANKFLPVHHFGGY